MKVILPSATGGRQFQCRLFKPSTLLPLGSAHISRSHLCHSIAAASAVVFICLKSIATLMDFSATSDDVLLAILGKLPPAYRLNVAPLVCRRMAGMQPTLLKAITSLTLTTSDRVLSVPSPFYLVGSEQARQDSDSSKQPEDHFSLQLPYAMWANGRVPAELPNISRLTIVLKDDFGFKAANEQLELDLLSRVAHYAGQLTSFACHFWHGHYNSVPLTLSADYIQRLLSIINYQMPKLRHLLLSTELSVIDCILGAGCATNHSPKKYTFLGSLYLPVLRRLVSFSFRSNDHADVLHYSLVKFGSANEKALKVRLILPKDSGETRMEGELWKRTAAAAGGTSCCCSRQLNYLSADWIQVDNFIQHISAFTFPRLEYLHLRLQDCTRKLLPLFTVLSASFPALRRLNLDLTSESPLYRWHDENVHELPALPTVTSLTLGFRFPKADYFETYLQPVRVFPSIRSLTLESFFGYRRCNNEPEVCNCIVNLKMNYNVAYPEGILGVVCIHLVLKPYWEMIKKGQLVVKYAPLGTNRGGKIVPYI